MNEGSNEIREQMEVRLVALLMGEASEFEAAELQAAMQKDPSLAEFYKEMEGTLGLVREASKKFSESQAPSAQPTLSADRRKKLLETFKVAKPKEFEQTKRASFWSLRPGLVVRIAAVLVAGCCLLGAAFLTLSGGKSKSQLTATRINEPQYRKLSGELPDSTIVLSKERVAPTATPPTDSLASSKPQTIAASDSSYSDQSARGGIYLPPNKTTSESAPALAASDLNAVATERREVNRDKMVAGRGPIGGGIGGAMQDSFAEDAPQAKKEELAPLNIKLPAPAFVGNKVDLNVATEKPATPPPPAAAAPTEPGAVAMATPAVPSQTDRFKKRAEVAQSSALPVVADDNAAAGRQFRSTLAQVPAAAPAKPSTELAESQNRAGNLAMFAASDKPAQLRDESGVLRVTNSFPEGTSGGLNQELARTDREATKFNASLDGSESKLGFVWHDERKQTGRATQSEKDTGSRNVVSAGVVQLAENEAVRRRAPEIEGRLRIQEGKKLYDQGRYDEAEAKLKELAKSDRAAAYYLDLTKEARYASDSRKREAEAKAAIADVTKSWKPEVEADQSANRLLFHAQEPVSGKIDFDRNAQFGAQQDHLYVYGAKDQEQKGAERVRVVEPPKDKSSESFLGKAQTALTGKTQTRMVLEIAKPEPTAATQNYFDPYFIQTQRELLRSEPVLAEAAKKLNLSQTWGEKSGAGRKLSETETYERLAKMIKVAPVDGTTLTELRIESRSPEEGRQIASAVVDSYKDFLQRGEPKESAAESKQKLVAQIDQTSSEKLPAIADDAPIRRASGPIPTPQPEVPTTENAFSTFSLNVSDVSFKLAQASLENNQLPDPASIRVEEFINAFNYRDPAPLPGCRLAFAWERARYPFAHNRDILRLGIQTAARGRDAQRPMNLVILLDNSGSMERPDRVAIIHEALKVLAAQLRPQDRVSLVAFARTARLCVDGMAGGDSNAFLKSVLDLNPEGGTNLEDAMNLGYATAMKHFMPNGVNSVILLTDGAANLGNVEPEDLKKKVVANRQKGIALDCFGIGWEGYNDDLLEVLTRNGDGRYGFINQPEQAGPQFADQLAGALNVAAADVKTQVEFNPARVTSWRQIGYAKHQLTKEQFRDNTVDAAEIAAAEQGNALYVIEVNPKGSGPLGTVRVRFKVPETGEYIEQAWPLEYQPQAPALDQASPAMRLAASASAIGEWLSGSPFAGEVSLSSVQALLTGIPETFSPDPRPQQLSTMLRQARTIVGK